MSATVSINKIDGSESQGFDDFDEIKSPYTVTNFRPLSDFEQVNGKWRAKVLVPANDDDEIKLWTLAEIYAEPDPVWLIEEIIQEASFNVLVGAPGSKKSFIAQELGSSVALGQAWLGRRVTQGDVVYIYAEGRKGLKFRAMAWDESRGMRPDRMRIIDRAIDVSNLHSIKKLVKAIRAAGLNPILIIIDTLARNFGDRDESKTQDMNAFIKGADALRSSFNNCSILVVHHTGWDEKHERGSSALRAAEDTNIRSVSKARSKTGYIEFGKIKDGDPEKHGKPEFKLVPTGKSVVLEWSMGVTGPDEVPLKLVPAKLLDAKKRAILSAISGVPNGALTREEIHRKTKIPLRTLSTHLKSLKDMGKLTQEQTSKAYKISQNGAPNGTRMAA